MRFTRTATTSSGAARARGPDARVLLSPQRRVLPARGLWRAVDFLASTEVTVIDEAVVVFLRCQRDHLRSLAERVDVGAVPWSC